MYFQRLIHPWGQFYSRVSSLLHGSRRFLIILHQEGSWWNFFLRNLWVWYIKLYVFFVANPLVGLTNSKNSKIPKFQNSRNSTKFQTFQKYKKIKSLNNSKIFKTGVETQKRDGAPKHGRSPKTGAKPPCTLEKEARRASKF